MTESGLAVLAVCAFYLLCLKGLRPCDAAAAVAAALGLSSWARARARRPAPDPRSLAAAAAATFLAGTAALPYLGVRLTLAAGAALLGLGALRGPRGGAPAAGRRPARPWLWALAAGAALGWVRCIALLTGNALYAGAWTLSALLLAAALGRRLLPQSARRPDAGRLEAALAAASALAGLAGLHFLRFIGLNCGAARYLHFPLGTPADAAFIAGQACAAILPWAAAAAAAAALPAADDEASAPAAWLLAAAPAAAAALQRRTGPAETAALFHCGLLLWAASRPAARAALKTPAAAKAGAAAALAALWLAWGASGTFRDVWHNRLNAAYPGGKFLAFQDDGGEALGVYQFSTGANVLLRDGGAQFTSDLAAKREAHVPLLMVDSPRRVLLVGVRQPQTLTAAMTHGIEADWLDTQSRAREVIAARAGEGWRWPDESRLRAVSGPLRRRLAPGAYDLILLDLPAPLHSPEAAFETTFEAFSAYKRALKPGGAVAVRIPAPYFRVSLSRLVLTAQAAFAHVGLLDLPGCPLVIASAEPLSVDPGILTSRFSVDAQADEPSLAQALREGLPWTEPVAIPDRGLDVQSDDRARNAFPLAEILGGSSIP